MSVIYRAADENYVATAHIRHAVVGFPIWEALDRSVVVGRWEFERLGDALRQLLVPWQWKQNDTHDGWCSAHLEELVAKACRFCIKVTGVAAATP